MNQVKIRSASVLSILAFACTVVPISMAFAANSNVVLTPNTVIPVRLDSEISSADAQQGDTFTATVNTNSDAYDSIMRGATVDGVVKQATPKQGSNPGTLDLKFTALHLSDGRTLALNGTPTSMDAKSIATDGSGLLTAKNTRKDQHLTYAGYGAGGGLLLGILSGHKLSLQDVVIGAALGYGAGSVTKGPTQIHDVDLKAGTDVGVLVGRNVSYHRSTSGDNSSSYGRLHGSSNIKHYTYNGQNWAMNRTTGNRWLVGNNDARQSSDAGIKYYTYQGHPWSMNTSTGERMQLD